MFTKTGVESAFKNGSFSFTNASNPTFSRPMAFSMPHEVSTILGGLFPLDCSSDKPFTIMAPSRFKSTRSLNSLAYPNVPDAVITGFLNSIPPMSTLRSGLFFIIFSVIVHYREAIKVP